MRRIDDGRRERGGREGVDVVDLAYHDGDACECDAASVDRDGDAAASDDDDIGR